jgi:hypothetical protein
MNNFVDAPSRDTNILGQPILTDPQGSQELLEENLARMDWRKLLGHFVLSLVVVRYLHVVSITVRPSEADPPLVVDPDAVLLLPIPSQLFEAVTRRDPKILECLRAIQNDQLSLSLPLKRGRELPGSLAPKDLLRLLIPEAPNHPTSW